MIATVISPQLEEVERCDSYLHRLLCEQYPRIETEYGSDKSITPSEARCRLDELDHELGVSIGAPYERLQLIWVLIKNQSELLAPHHVSLFDQRFLLRYLPQLDRIDALIKRQNSKAAQ